MNTLPKLSIEGLSHPDIEGLVSPVTPATVESGTAYRENDFGNKRLRVGGLPISALVNGKDDESPVSYPGKHQAPVGTEAVTPGRPEFPSILYQMSEFVVQLEERAAEGNPPAFKSPTTEGLIAQKVSVDGYPSRGREPIPIGNEVPKCNTLPPLKVLKFAITGKERAQQVQGRLLDGSLLRARASTAKSKNNEALEHDSTPIVKVLGVPTTEQEATKEELGKSTERHRPRLAAESLKESFASGHDDVVAADKGNNSARSHCQEKPKASGRKRTRAEREMPITTKSEIEIVINRLRDRGQKMEEAEKENKTASLLRTTRGDAEAGSPTGPTAHNLICGVSKGSNIATPRKLRRGRPNGDSRPRPHACPTCQLRFHQQSGVVNHYRVVHLKEKRFECPHKCGLKFGARGDVTRHVDAVHKKIRNFECQVCGDAFARKSILTRHCKNIHSDVFGADEAHDCVHGCVYRAGSK